MSSRRSANRLIPPKSWRDPASHWRSVLAHPWYRNLAQLQHHLTYAVHEFFVGRGLMAVSMPVTTASISSPMGLGSDSLPVEVDLFGVKTYLADSMQFMLEFGCRLHPAGVYYLMPCFRGEATDATHLPQFYHAEAEIKGRLDDVIELSSALIHHLARALLDDCPNLILAMAGTMKHVEELLLLEGRFPRVRLGDITSELCRVDDGLVHRHPAGFEVLTRAGEAKAVEMFGTAGTLWLTHFEQLAVPFYQAHEPQTGRALNGDFLLGGRETVGCGQRHETSAEVKHAMAGHQVAPEPYAWYTEMRDLHPMLTSGFGLGMERLVMWLTGHDDIRDLTLLYRENGRDVVP